ncbi:MAG: UDP-N-acetylmuramoyl-L-alanyl-D-glutamate--2,6-diaminopimelate ligase [Patescibacteria group bacterium]|nr:UDP-N-acetylmuramoyl-L-alanyl-D-glutamate--2,6-diaminopimelate ligase [Patescibacteria group bacterium]
MTIKRYAKSLKDHNLILDTNLPQNLEISGISSDSRKIEKGNIFVAIKGLTFDGHRFITEAKQKGAVTFVVEKKLPQEYPYIQVADTRKALACLWSTYYNHPQKKLKIIGVTGTDGKTTTTYLIQHFLKAARYEAGLISTVKACWNDKEIPTGQHVSTPEPKDLFKILSQMVKDNCTYIVVETTSHGLDQDRVFGINFEVGVLTNITPEHLDYHHTFEEYKKTKAKLFQNSQISVLNENDPQINYFKNKAKGAIKTYDHKKEKLNLKYDKKKLPGDYNRANILAAKKAARIFNVSDRSLQEGLKKFQPPKGRFQEIVSNQPFKIIIDFAHTPNALKALLSTVNKIKNKNSGIICVFGCEGERDKGKRVPMGKISAHYAKISILTAVDPRNESLKSINKTIAFGLKVGGAHKIHQKNIHKLDNTNTNKHFFIQIPDRARAIKKALQLARVGDWVLVLGKGHEKTMNLGSGEVPWSDQQAIKNALTTFST